MGNQFGRLPWNVKQEATPWSKEHTIDIHSLPMKEAAEDHDCPDLQRIWYFPFYFNVISVKKNQKEII